MGRVRAHKPSFFRSRSKPKIRGLNAAVTVPFRVGRDRAVPAAGRGRYRLAIMLNWDSIFQWGRRASDLGAAMPPVVPTRDLILEAAIAHEQIDVLFQPLIEPESGRIVGAE